MDLNERTLIVLLGDESADFSPPCKVAGWQQSSARLSRSAPEDLHADLLLLNLDPADSQLYPWLSRFRVLNPGTHVALAEAEAEREWYRNAIRLGVDELLPWPPDAASWEAYLRDRDEALQAGIEQERQLGRLERNTQSLDRSRRQLAELLLLSYENLGRVHAQLGRRLEQLSTLYELGRDLSLESNWDRALTHFLNSCVQVMEFKGVAILLWSYDEGRLNPRASLLLEDAELASALDILRELPAGGRRDSEIRILGQAGLHAVSDLDPEAPAGEMLVLPLVHGGEAQGFLLAAKDYPSREAISDDLHFLKTVQALLGEELANAKAIQRLKRLGELHRSVLENVPAAVLTVDGRGRVAYRNPQAARLFGPRLELGQAFATDAEFQVMDGSEAGFDAAWQQREFRLRGSHSGGERRLLVSTALLSLRHESDPAVVMICEDFTEYQRLEGELRQAERLSSLGRLSAGVAHEIRNPLAGIATTAQVLQSRLDASHEAHPFLDRIQGEIQRLERIVRSLLDLSRPAKPELVALDLRQATHRALAAAQGAATAAGVELTAPEHAAPVAAWADPDQLHQVLLNLLLNAVEACGQGDQVALSFSRRAAVGGGEGRVQLRVEDTGPGVPEELAERLFEPFVTGKAEGTGLGLAICRKIMEEHGGGLQHRDREGGGTEFVIDLAPATAGATQQEARF